MNKNSSNSGMSFCAVLTIVFIALKVTGNITWSWWWVLSPLWLDIIVSILLLAWLEWRVRK